MDSGGSCSVKNTILDRVYLISVVMMLTFLSLSGLWVQMNYVPTPAVRQIPRDTCDLAF